MGHSSSSFWGTASPGRGSNPRPPVPMALNIPEGHRGIGAGQIGKQLKYIELAVFETPSFTHMRALSNLRFLKHKVLPEMHQ